LSELKTFIAAGTKKKKKSGQTDDLVSALLLVIRMSTVLADWDPRVMDLLSSKDTFEEDWEPPLPIFVSSNI
jgi:hypothetical protein